MLRHTVQFHWTNCATGRDFDAFLASLSHDKRKKIRQERRKVADAGVSFRWSRGTDIRAADWDFFYRCYARTYREHGNAPYLNRDFFQRMAATMPEAWLLFIAERDGKPIAASLIALSAGLAATALRQRRGRLRPLLGRARARRLPALRGLLLPAAAVVHRARRRSASRAARRASTRWRAR